MIFNRDQLSVWMMKEMVACSTFGLSIYGSRYQPIVLYNLTTISFLALLESSWLKQYFSDYSALKVLLKIANKACFGPQRKNWMWLMWDTNYKEEHCATQDEMFSWNIFLHSMSQLFNNLAGWLELSHCQETCNTSSEKYTQVKKLSQRVFWLFYVEPA